jgi:hypothetical protein
MTSSRKRQEPARGVQPAKVLSGSPYTLAVRRRMERGWDVLCLPGPLAELLADLAVVSRPLETQLVDGIPLVVVPLTVELDQAIQELVDTLITLRYETEQVQLRLFDPERVL